MDIIIEKVCTKSFEMSFFKFGEGEKTLVILPGLSIQSVMNSAQAVAKEYEVMNNDFTVYVFDRREELPPAYSVEEMARDTAEAIKALGLKDICLFGASQGGMLAMVIAIEYPQLVKRLVIGSSSACVKQQDCRVIDEWISLAEKKDRIGLYLDFGEKIYPQNIFNQYKSALIDLSKGVTDTDMERFIILAKGTKDFDILDRLNEISCPVLAIGCADDSVLGFSATEEMAKKLCGNSDFELYVYDGYGHAAFDTALDYRNRLYSFFIKDNK